MASGPDLSDIDLTKSDAVNSKWKVDWTDILTGSVAAILTAFFGSIAETISAAFGVLLRPLWGLAKLLSAAVDGLVNADALAWAPANGLVEVLGFPGAVALVVAGLVMVAYVVGWIR